MKIRDYEAPTLKECLQKVRDDLGPDAVILETRKGEVGGFLGVGKRTSVRIVAATGIAVTGADPRAPAARTAPEAVVDEDEMAEARAGILRVAERARAARAAASVAPPTAPAAPPAPADLPRPAQPDKLTRLEQEVGLLREALSSVAAREPRPVAAQVEGPDEAVLELSRLLHDAELLDEISKDLIRSLPDLRAWASPAREALAESAARSLLSQRIQVSGGIEVRPGDQRIVAFVGPTGVGKTTTAAKLAARFSLVQKLKVGLITLDTYRIAAVDQLRTYSQIIGVPLRVVAAAGELPAAIGSFQSMDVILIDTAGRSHRNDTQIDQLTEALGGIRCETHLVLSASTRYSDLMDQVARFRPVGVSRLLLTKLDETATYGTIASVALKAGLPVSFITNGQKVPEDIEVADAERLANLVLHGGAATARPRARRTPGDG